MEEKLREKFPVRPEHRDLNEVLVGCAQLLDTIKGEWGEAWSEWDQSVRNGITLILLNQPPDASRAEQLERAQPATPLPSIASTSFTIGPINEGSVERICNDCGAGYTTRDGHTCQPSVAAQGTDGLMELAKDWTAQMIGGKDMVQVTLANLLASHDAARDKQTREETLKIGDELNQCLQIIVTNAGLLADMTNESGEADAIQTAVDRAAKAVRALAHPSEQPRSVEQAKCPYCGHAAHLPPNWKASDTRLDKDTCQWCDTGDKTNYTGTCNCPHQIPRVAAQGTDELREFLERESQKVPGDPYDSWALELIREVLARLDEYDAARDKRTREPFSDLAVEMMKHSNDHIHDESEGKRIAAATEGVCADRINAILSRAALAHPEKAAQ